MTFINDGTGRGYLAKVSDDNRIATNAVSRSILQDEVKNGNAYNVSTPRLTLTSVNESALLFLENLESEDLFINEIFVNIIDVVGTVTGQPTIRIYRNPRVGTIIDNEIALNNDFITNLNFGNQNLLEANIYIGGEGETVSTNQNIIDVPLGPVSAVTLTQFDIDLILSRGSALAITYQPGSGTTSVDALVGFTAARITQEF